jgi:predicted NAD/FAD-binding protein
MPSNKAAWASWNYVDEGPKSDHRPLAVNYHLNRLQHHHTETQYFLSLNRQTPVQDASIIRRIHFTHPKFSVAAIQSQSVIRELSGQDHIHYCGSYLGNGFHEDAVKSAFDMVEGIQ